MTEQASMTERASMTDERDSSGQFDVAIVGLSGRWPGAGGLADFWTLLSSGVDAIRPFDDDELRRRGVDEARLRDPQFVKAGAVLADADLFAAGFFGYSPREAALLDPQHRIFLECAWEVLEHAGYAPRHVPGQVGVFASCGLSTYLLFNVCRNADVDEKDEAFQAMIGSDKDFVATRVSYKLNFTGPSVTVQTGCSSSLVAVGMAVQSLLTYQCDMALAGGVTVAVPHRTGYWHLPGGIASPDGRCRPFATDAAGTVFGDGAGVIVLKRLADAVAAGDAIHAVIRGVAINNDGSAKVGYTAPSIAGQTDVIRRALALANVGADSIGYVEAHGTATGLGDPAEVMALTQAFGADTDAQGFCALGSVKGNIGHLDAAAGITGLIKTVLMLTHRTIVPSLHCDAPNPRIDFARSPFIVNTTLREWTTRGGPRRAGVSSFGIGGTNAHVILEEAPAPAARHGRPPRAHQILTLSAESRTALDAASDRLARYLADKAQHPADKTLHVTDEADGVHLADAAFTSQVGREALRYRRVVIAESTRAAAERLRTRDREFVHAGDVAAPRRTIVLMFPGGAAQYAGMGQDLYRAEPVFAQAVDACATRLAPTLGLDLRDLLCPAAGRMEDAAQALERLTFALPAICTASYAVAQLLASWGVRPKAMIGHSLGEYVAAHMAGVLSLEDLLDVVALRGRLIDSLPPGAMLSVYLSHDEISALGLRDVSVAAINAPDNCVIAGPAESVDRAAAQLEAREVECRRLHINAAAHSLAVEPIVEAWRTRMRAVRLSPPTVPYVSNLTGTWITDAEATDPEYWASHLRQPVQFAAGVATLAAQPDVVFVEVGPGRTLGSFVKTQLKEQAAPVVSMMKHARDARPDDLTLCEGAAKLWLAGVDLDWRLVHADEDRRRVALPTYPFERQRYWIDRPIADAQVLADAAAGDAAGAAACYLPGWTRTRPVRSTHITDDDRTASWLLFSDDGAVADALRQRLQGAGARVTVIHHGPPSRDPDPKSPDQKRHSVEPTSVDDYRAVLKAARQGDAPVRAVHLWSLDRRDDMQDRAAFADVQRTGLFSLVALGQAAMLESMSIDMLVVASRLEQVSGADETVAAMGTLGAGCIVLSQELDGVRCRIVDVGERWREPGEAARVADRVIGECVWDADVDRIVAFRGARRWSRRYERVAVAAEEGREWLRRDGVYLLVGGTGEIGLTLAQAFARATRCRIALTGRTGDARQIVDPAGRTRAPIADALKAIAAAGSEAVVYAADAADPIRMRDVVHDIERRWGALTGIVHLAGVTGAAALQPVIDLSASDFDAHFEPKAHGMYVLQRLMADRRLDFCVSFSSTASILGGTGMLPYAAANAFLDTLAAERAGADDTRWISVNWDGWLTMNSAPFASAALARYAMPADAAVGVLARILSSDLSGQIVVSMGDLHKRIAEWTTPARDGAARTSGGGVVEQARPDLMTDYVAPRTPLEKDVAGIWSRVLGIGRIGVHDNLFELGGNSLIALRIAAQVKRLTGIAMPVTALFEAPTVQMLTGWLDAKTASDGAARLEAPLPDAVSDPSSEAVATTAPNVATPILVAPAAASTTSAPATLVPVAGRRDRRRRAPRADEDDAGIAIIGMAGRFPGADSVRELWSGLSQGKELIRREQAPSPAVDDIASTFFVRATAALSDHESFDAGFFGMPPAEAMLRDPQHRLFLEQSWAALEDAGYDPRRYPHRIGVFGGATTNTYLTRNIAQRPDIMAAFDPVQINVANGPDFLTTLVSYKLNLTGPSHSVQSACSTSLVAIHSACRSLMNDECDMALAGGVSVNLMLMDGYRYVEGGILSADGYCRAFDAKATGTVFGSGVGLVVLKRLDEAIADGDFVHAVIRGSAVNNDGGIKAGYTAPSVEGEARVIEDALDAARVSAETIAYVECHGTGTRLGDPIELRALTKAYRRHTARRGYCAIGSVKTNVGHLDAAAGVTGVIKVVESLKHGLMPPSLHFTEPNPQIDFAPSPFYVNAKPQAWPRGGDPRRGAVSAFGVGGTNAHVILEEAPARPAASPHRRWQLLVWSGKTREAMALVRRQLGAYLRDAADDLALADVAWTLQTGRHRLPWRRILVSDDTRAAGEALAGEVDGVAHDQPVDDASSVVFVCSSGEEPRLGLGRELYDEERVYRDAIDRCATVVEAECGVDLRRILVDADAAERTRQPWLVQAALTATAYAQAALWEAWGIKPAAILGDDLAEYVAACLAGVLSIDAALRLAILRARSTATGEDAEAAAAFADAVARTPRGPIRIPFVSSVTGTWATDTELRTPEYWVRPLRARAPIERGSFDRALDTLLADRVPVVVEIGAGRDLMSRLRRRAGVRGVASAGAAGQSDVQAMLDALGRLWIAGVDIDWRGVADEPRRRVPLPTYPFERTRLWIDPPAPSNAAQSSPAQSSPAQSSQTQSSVAPSHSEARVMLTPTSRSTPTSAPTSAPAPSAVEPPRPAPVRGRRPALRNAYVSPRGSTEQAIVEIVEAALAIYPVGVTDRFGELGGDSLLAVRIVDAINARLGCRLRVLDLYDDVTIRALGERLAGEATLVANRRD